MKQAGAVLAVLLLSLTSLAQNEPQSSPPPDQQNQAAAVTPVVTIPAGTSIAMVLTHPIQSRHMHRGDDIYAQVTSPVDAGGEVVVPPGTFVQGIVDKLTRNHGRAELRLQAMSITFPDGYVATISGPVTLETVPGYAVMDTGPGRAIGALALPAAGAGLGALIGHSAGKADSTVTSSLPPGCIAAPPFCTQVTTPVFGTKGRDAIIGAGIGGMIGGIGSLALILTSRQFFIDVGAPVDMTLQHPVSLERKEVDAAVQGEAEHPVAVQPVRPLPPPPAPAVNQDHGTCYTPEIPGTPPTIIPGTPGPDGIPGPPTVIPGTPPTPGMPYPCP